MEEEILASISLEISCEYLLKLKSKKDCMCLWSCVYGSSYILHISIVTKFLLGDYRGFVETMDITNDSETWGIV